MNGDTIGALAVLFLFGGPVAAWIVHRVFSHAEYMAMIRNGMTPPPDPRAMRRAAKYGWAPPPTGNAWSTPPPPVAAPAGYGEYAGYYAQRQLHRGMVTAFVGLAILIGLSFISPGHVGPWLLGGLIPMFVGLAQIITAVLGGAQINVPTHVGGPSQGSGQPSQPGTFGQPQQTQTQTPPPPTPDGYGAWRPGSMPSIEKPASPPENR